MLNSTSVSLLRRLRENDHQEAWQRFVELYAPLILHWARGQGLGATDATDLTQDVMTVLVKELRSFEYDPRKDRFRGWLRTITVNKSRDYLRRQSVRAADCYNATVEQQAATANGVDLFEEAEYRSYLVNRALNLMKSEFKEETWRACWKQVVEEKKAGEVAREMGLSQNVVYLAKSRVLGRLREELRELIE